MNIKDIFLPSLLDIKNPSLLIDNLLIIIPGNWESCNATCLAKSGVKHREVQCRDRATNLLSNDCNLDRRPFDIKRCYYRRQCTNEKNGNFTCTIKTYSRKPSARLL